MPEMGHWETRRGALQSARSGEAGKAAEDRVLALRASGRSGERPYGGHGNSKGLWPPSNTQDGYASLAGSAAAPAPFARRSAFHFFENGSTSTSATTESTPKMVNTASGLSAPPAAACAAMLSSEP